MKGLLMKKGKGENALLNGFLALLVIGGIALGCTCNDKEGFQWGSTDSNSSTDKKTDDDDKPAVEKADASKGEIPEDEELQQIVKETLLDFNEALQEEDFDDFHSKISKAWQRQVTPRQLKRNFQPFIDGNADISDIKSMKASWDGNPDTTEKSGMEVLEVNGSYDTSPNPTSFELKYIPEGKEWKLFGIFVKTNISRR